MNYILLEKYMVELKGSRSITEVWVIFDIGTEKNVAVADFCEEIKPRDENIPCRNRFQG